MSLAEILPKLHELDRTDKWRTVQFLIAELSQEEGIPFTHGATYPIWSPYDSYEAAATLMKVLREEGASYEGS
jgi:hypothetical protein